MQLMRSASRYLPEKGEHIQSSELCATCHTLVTHTLDADGEVVGELPEQVPWHSPLHCPAHEPSAFLAAQVPLQAPWQVPWQVPWPNASRYTRSLFR